jgi:chemotaxis protein methyltransferase CheR
MPITTSQFNYIRDLVQKHSAVVVAESERYLVESRLTPVAKEYQCCSVLDFIRQTQQGLIEKAEEILVEAMMTTDSTFFRDFHPWEALKNEILPELRKRRSTEQKLSIWCAGCSTGQEPYSLAILLKEHFPQLPTWNVRILATDISHDAVETAQQGYFNQLEVNRGLPASLLVKHFRQEGAHWRVKEELRELIEFMPLNLAAPWPAIEKADLILLRNVIGQFAVENKQAVFKKLKRVLKPDGFLILGAKETTKELDDAFEAVEFNRATAFHLSPSARSALSDKYALEGGEGSSRLAELISCRDDANLGEIIKTISTDQALKTRLLRAANPNARNNRFSITSVEDALLRTGAGFLVVLAMGDPLMKAVHDTFSTMLSISPEMVDPQSIETYWQGQMIGTAKFSGKATGSVHIRFKRDFAQALAAQMIGINVEEVEPSVIKDVVSELVNMVVGNFKSNLSDSGLSCRLEVPEVAQLNSFHLDLSNGAKHEQLAFRYQGEPILVDIVVNSMD